MPGDVMGGWSTVTVGKSLACAGLREKAHIQILPCPDVQDYWAFEPAPPLQPLGEPQALPVAQITNRREPGLHAGRPSAPPAASYGSLRGRHRAEHRTQTRPCRRVRSRRCGRLAAAPRADSLSSVRARRCSSDDSNPETLWMTTTSNPPSGCGSAPSGATSMSTSTPSLIGAALRLCRLLRVGDDTRGSAAQSGLRRDLSHQTRVVDADLQHALTEAHAAHRYRQRVACVSGTAQKHAHFLMI